MFSCGFFATAAPPLSHLRNGGGRSGERPLEPPGGPGNVADGAPAARSLPGSPKRCGAISNSSLVASCQAGADALGTGGVPIAALNHTPSQQ